MLEDKTYEVKTWDHNDAVIYVTETSGYLKSDPEKNDGTGMWVTETNVVTVVPVNNVDGVDDEFISKVQETAASLAALYEGSPDLEIKIHYTINSHPYVNL